MRLPDTCPVCDTPLVWQNDFLKCTGATCRAQIEQRLSHWFRILGNADWFGIKTIRKIVDHGHDRLETIYGLTEPDFIEMGFGPVQSKNLAEAITTSRTKPVEDWRFLAAFGIADLGTGDSRKLLAHVPLEKIVELDQAAIAQIKGFGDKTSQHIVESIGAMAGSSYAVDISKVVDGHRAERHDEVAVEDILEGRNGVDGIPGTEDDGFSSVQEVLAVTGLPATRTAAVLVRASRALPQATPSSPRSGDPLGM